MNHDNEHQDLIENLDRLAEGYRTEADEGFEGRMLDATRQPEASHRHRHKKGTTAWIPFATAAAVGIFAYMWFPRSAIPVPGQEDEQAVTAAAGDESSAADLWLASYETMEALIAGSDDFDDSLDWIDLLIDATENEFDSELDWYQIGESL